VKKDFELKSKETASKKSKLSLELKSKETASKKSKLSRIRDTRGIQY